MALKFSHIGVAVASIEQALRVYETILGYSLLSGPVKDPIQNVYVCFLRTGEAGDPMIELVAPAGEDSPVNRVLAKGIGAYHMCYEAENIDTVFEDLRSKGCLVISRPVPATAFAGHRIAWFYTPTRQLMELVER